MIARQIHNNLVDALGLQAITYPTVTRFLCGGTLNCLYPGDPDEDWRTERDEINSVILVAQDD
jgi:hypothetical protein